MRFKLVFFIFIVVFFAFLPKSNLLAATVDVTITGSNTFSPSSVTINAGDTVRWTANVSFVEVASDTHLEHYVYPDPSCQNDPDRTICWDGPILTSGQTYSFTFMIAGTWYYHDHQSSQASGQAGPARIIVNDTRAPAAVSNLASSGATTASISLTWTSPGDDQGNYVNYGTPGVYDIRYSTSASASGASWWATNWGTATQVSGEPTPGSAGTSESMTVSGLSSGTTYYLAMKTRDEVPNESALSNILTRATADPADTTAPAAITNLSLSSPSETSITLSWTAPGDDGNTGTAQSYDIRYSTSLITSSNWSSATQVTGEPAPAAAGTSQSMTVSGLTRGTNYYFAMKTTDESNNESGLSNVPNLSTITPSSSVEERYGDVTPPAKINNLEIIKVSTSTVELFWTAPGDDEMAGTATAYDMRYAQENITLSNWPFIMQASGEPEPKISGTKQSMTISELRDGTLYYFAITSKDERGNDAPFSNVMSTTTIALTKPPAPPPPKEEPKKEEKRPEEKAKEPPPPAIPPSPITPISPPPKISPQGELIRAKGDDKVYLLKDGKKIWIPTPEAFNAAGYDWTRIKEVAPADSAKIIDALIIKAENRLEVYIIEGGSKRHIPNADAFNAYGYKWDEVLETRAAILAGYQTESRFVKDIEDFKIFLQIWIKDFEKGLASARALPIPPYNIDVKIYLEAWIAELKSKLSVLNNTSSPFYREINSALQKGDVEFCLKRKKSAGGTPGVELCLNSKYYGGGGLETMFKSHEEKVL